MKVGETRRKNHSRYFFHSPVGHITEYHRNTACVFHNIQTKLYGKNIVNVICHFYVIIFFSQIMRILTYNSLCNAWLWRLRFPEEILEMMKWNRSLLYNADCGLFESGVAISCSFLHSEQLSQWMNYAIHAVWYVLHGVPRTQDSTCHREGSQQIFVEWMNLPLNVKYINCIVQNWT